MSATPLRLRLFHARDGARIAYREAGTGPGLVLVHSAGLSHREWEPVVEHLAHRFRVVLPDLPGHGDSEDRPRHPWTLDWMARVLAAFCEDTAGARPLVGGHGLGAELLLRATVAGELRPGRLVVAPTRLHRPAPREGLRGMWRAAARAGGLPGLDRAASHAAPLLFRPRHGLALSARGAPSAADVVAHAMSDVAGNANLSRSWARLAARLPRGAWRDLLDAYPGLDAEVLLLWADEDRHHPLQTAEEALGLLPRAQLRVVPGTGYLLAHDDPVAVAREIAAFCG
ncbi:alpha/beta fold hydrolase [Conexibacter sp. SYSU D00693]|uniref:alpha/beta fold hydrolase n=1 Tax=Conexibacter sp. SYSU D00693 TaxID=2812560 RepID=UPI00196A3B64|nr:alpha/beta hydrolase [Conexibacter sp. SYSU D00693]